MPIKGTKGAKSTVRGVSINNVKRQLKITEQLAEHIKDIRRHQEELEKSREIDRIEFERLRKRDSLTNFRESYPYRYEGYKRAYRFLLSNKDDINKIENEILILHWSSFYLEKHLEKLKKDTKALKNNK